MEARLLSGTILLDLSVTLLIHYYYMTTIKKRVNISLSAPIEDILTKLAKRDQVPQATKAAELVRIAIELEEDKVFDEITSKRDTKKAKFVSHKKVWI